MAKLARGSTRPQLPDALRAGLSTDEVAQVTEAAFRALDAAGRKRLLRQLPTDTAAALERLLEAGSDTRTSRAEPTVSKAKLLQDWQRLWGDWQLCVEESNDEKGRFVYKDAHWEPPNLDRASVLDELDRIAKAMRAMLPRVWVDGLDPTLDFADAIREANEEIGAGLPDWYCDHGEAAFGPEVTGCLLDWSWRVAQRDARTAFQFLEAIRELESALTRTGLDARAILDFVAAIPPEHQRVIYEGLTTRARSPLWADALSQPFSSWFKVRQHLARKCDRGAFLEGCRANIDKDWALALPVISDLLRKKQHVKALAVVDGAMRTMLRDPSGARWDPTRELLIVRGRYFPTETVQRQLKLLALWAKCACAVGDAGTASALEVQCAIGADWEDWDRALAAFAKAKPACPELLHVWQLEVARASVGAGSSNQPAAEEWVVQVARAASADIDRTAAMSGIRDWLARLETTPGASAHCGKSLATLALDLDAATGALRARGPRLKTLLEGEFRGRSKLERSRRAWMSRLRAEELQPEVLAFLERHIRHFVPDPSFADYSSCAQGMAAALEFAPDQSRKLLEEWRDVHRRKRNLWKAMEARGLSL